MVFKLGSQEPPRGWEVEGRPGEDRVGGLGFSFLLQLDLYFRLLWKHIQLQKAS